MVSRGTVTFRIYPQFLEETAGKFFVHSPAYEQCDSVDCVVQLVGKCATPRLPALFISKTQQGTGIFIFFFSVRTIRT